MRPRGVRIRMRGKPLATGLGTCPRGYTFNHFLFPNYPAFQRLSHDSQWGRFKTALSKRINPDPKKSTRLLDGISRDQGQKSKAGPDQIPFPGQISYEPSNV